MQFKLEFEPQEGYFNEDGVWVERPDPDAVKDAWLDSEEGASTNEYRRRHFIRMLMQDAVKDAWLDSEEGAFVTKSSFAHVFSTYSQDAKAPSKTRG